MKIYTDEEITKKLNRRNKIRRVIDFIIYPIVVILFICCGIIVLQVIKNPKEMPNLFGCKAFNVISGSMEPKLEVGDIVIAKRIEIEDIKDGDIITFRQENTIITHRIVEIIQEDGNVFYETKGDNNNTKDEELVKYEDIEGKFVFKIPKIGLIIRNIKNTTSIIIIVLILYLIYKILQMKDDRKIARHEKRKELEKK